MGSKDGVSCPRIGANYFASNTPRVRAGLAELLISNSAGPTS